MKIVELGLGLRPIPPTGYGGIEQTVWDLTTHMRKLGHTVEVVDPVYTGSDAKEWRRARKAPSLVSSLDADILHIHSERQGFFLGLRDIPYILDSHIANWTYEKGDRSKTFNRFHNRLMFFPELCGARWAEGIVAESVPQMFGIEHRARPIGPVEFINTGVDTDFFAPNGSSGDPNVVLGIGVVQPRKRWHLAAEALDGTGMKLRIVGPTSGALGAVPSYVEKMRSYPNVELLGEVPRADLVRELHGCGMVVHPSSGETVGLAVLQALAAGRPVIASGAITVVNETDGALVEHLGPDELYTEPETLPKFIRNHAIRLRDHEEERVALGKRGREVMLERFSWEQVARAHLKFFDFILWSRMGKPMLPARDRP
jgi:glycosyltransferase involved in cell wall biosynthesis